MIENDLRVIKKTQKVTRTKTTQGLEKLARRQVSHEKANIKQFQVVTEAIKALPTQDVILKTISDTIKVVVNGKIDLINNKVDLVGEHLKRQDAAMDVMSAKIKPVDGIVNWFKETFRGVVYIGAIAAAIWAIIKLFHLKI